VLTVTPFQPEDLSAPWLTAVLRKSAVLPSARVVSVRRGPVPGAPGMTGRLVRLALEYDYPEPHAPASIVAKFSAVDPHVRDVVHAMGFYERETRFYAELAPLTPVATPRCFASEVDAETGESVLLLEDLGWARTGCTVAGCSPDEARLAVDNLARLHARWWADPLLDKKLWLRRSGRLAADQLTGRFQESWPSFVAKLSHPPDEAALRAASWIERHLERVTNRFLTDPPLTLVHQDYAADNMFFTGPADSRGIVVIDWQLTEQGHAAMDVAAFLGGSIDRLVRRAHEHRLLASYHETLLRCGVQDYPFDRLLRDYRLAMLLPLARLVDAVGTHPGISGDPAGFWNVLFPRYCAAVDDLDVGQVLSER
jgi:aminoglycoside phosphotransferase (APT) family kinase protein